MLGKIVLSGIGLVLIGLARFGFNWVALHWLGEDDTGRLNLALSMAFLVSLPAATAFGPLALRYIARARGQGQEAQASRVLRAMLLGTALVSAALVAAMWWARGSIASWREIPSALVLHAAVIGSAYALYTVLRSALYALDRVRAYTALELVAGLAFFAGLGLLVALGARDGILLSFVVGYAVFSLGALFIERGRLAPAKDAPALPRGEMTSFAILALIGTASSMSIREIGTLLAPDYADLAGTAHFAICLAFLAPLQFMPRTLRSVLFAHSAEQEGRGGTTELARTFSEVNHWLLLANIPIVVVVITASGTIISLMGGTSSPERALVLQILAVAAGLEIIATPAVNALAGIGRIGVNAGSALAGLVIALVTWALLGPSMGLTGLALGYLASSVARSLVPVMFARRLLGLGMTRSPTVVLLLGTLSAVAIVTAVVTGAELAVSGLYVLVVLVVLRSSIGEVLALARSRRGGGH